MKFAFYCLFILFLFSHCTPTKTIYYEGKASVNSTSNASIEPENIVRKPGSCYQKCTIPEESRIVENPVLLYTGVTPEITGVTRLKLVTQERSSSWVKKKANNGCNAPNPDDCLVWCLVEIPELSESYWIVTDTSLVKEYENTIIEQEFIVEESSIQWREVLCEKDITTTLLNQVNNILLVDFNPGLQSDVLTTEMKSALRLYQMKHNLPSGGIDMETLQHMGIEIK